MKRSLLIAASFGAGAVLTLAILAGVGYWYVTRPKPPQPWNIAALASLEAPGFVPAADGKHIRFNYTVKNNTKWDYRVDSAAQLTILAKLRSDNKSEYVSGPDFSQVATLDLPIFIPAQQVGTLSLLLAEEPPQRKEHVSDDAYHEQLRSFLNEHIWDAISGFVVYDGSNRYQINLPPNRSTAKPTDATDVPPCPANDPLGILDASKPCKPPSIRKHGG